MMEAAWKWTLKQKEEICQKCQSEEEMFERMEKQFINFCKSSLAWSLLV